MRIISGKFKGRVIKGPKCIRPTQDKVREALFNILGDIQGVSFLELYAGSGVVGLEALSQGASKVVFVEKNRQCCTIIKKNIEMLDTGYSILDTRCENRESRIKNQGLILLMDAFRAISMLHKNQQKFDVIFLDPPYHQDLAKKTLKSLSRCDILPFSGLIICQYSKKDILPEVVGNLMLIKQAKYGDNFLSFYKKIASR